MSGALAAALQSACCCGRDGNGGGGSPDDCGPSGPGAESDRATTAISVSLDLSYTEEWLENKIVAYRAEGDPGSSMGQVGYAPKNCVIWNGVSCENEYPNGDIYIPYRCGPLTFTGGVPNFFEARGFNPPQATIRYGTCYNQTGDSNHLQNYYTPGTQCYCQRIGGCAGCSPVSVTASGGTVIASQVSPGSRSWRTYLTPTFNPTTTIATWNWQSGITSEYTRSGPGFVHRIRRFCQPPIPLQQFGQMPPYVHLDPSGRYVSTDPDQQYPGVTGRWGFAFVGPLHLIADVQVAYLNTYTSQGVNLGPGWLAEVRLAHMYRDQHLALRHRFGLINQERWHIDNGVPPESGYLPLTNATKSPVTDIPWRMWKPCAGINDTVLGSYVAIGVSPTGDPAERDMYFAEPCLLAGYKRGQGYLPSLTIS